MDHRLDEIDRRIIFHLMRNARDVSAPEIAEEVNVTAGTIRNRINQLVEEDVIIGFHANVDFEHAEGLLTTLFICTAVVPDRHAVLRQVREIPGVVNVRELRGGRGNLHVKAVGRDTDDLDRIGRELTKLGADIEEENLIQDEQFYPYRRYGPEDEREGGSMTDVMSLTGGSEVIELAITEDAPIAGMTVEDADSRGLIDENVLLVSIERGDTIITPKGATRIHPDDVVTIFSRNGTTEDLLESFTG